MHATRRDSLGNAITQENNTSFHNKVLLAEFCCSPNGLLREFYCVLFVLRCCLLSPSAELQRIGIIMENNGGAALGYVETSYWGTIRELRSVIFDHVRALERKKHLQSASRITTLGGASEKCPYY